MVEGLTAKNEVMLDGFNDGIALDDMNCQKAEYSGYKERVVADVLTCRLLEDSCGIIGALFELDRRCSGGHVLTRQIQIIPS